MRSRTGRFNTRMFISKNTKSDSTQAWTSPHTPQPHDADHHIQIRCADGTSCNVLSGCTRKSLEFSPQSYSSEATNMPWKPVKVFESRNGVACRTRVFRTHKSRNRY